MGICLTDDGCEPCWYVSELCNLIADYCLTWREPLMTYQLYGIVAAIVGTSLYYSQLLSLLHTIRLHFLITFCAYCVPDNFSCIIISDC